MPDYVPATTLAALRERPQLFKRGRDHVALFEVKGAVYAVDNRCPHEGYPLIQGELKECTLTCSYHNFKFDLRDGQCLMGDEAVRTYPVRVEGDAVFVDLTPPDLSQQIPALWSSLETGMREYRMGQVARDVARLLQAGVPGTQVALFGADYDARHGQWGPSHALPVAADVLQWLPFYDGLDAAYPLVQALDSAAEPNVRRAQRATPAPAHPGDPATFAARLRVLVEDEDGAAAEALVRGAVEGGWDRSLLEPAFLALCADHFLDYAHALIYCIKVFDLLDAAGWERASNLLGALVFGIVTGTREDVLPSWAGWRERVAAERPRWSGQRRNTGSVHDVVALQAAVLAGKARAATDAVAHALASGASPTAVAHALSGAAAERYLRFDPTHELSLDNQESWLSVTHVLTFANAVRQALERTEDPSAMALLYQLARMIQYTHRLDAAERVDTHATTAQPLDELEEHLSRGDVQDAVGVAAAWLDSDPSALREALMRWSISDVATRPIVVAHLMKLAVAAFEEFDATGDPRGVLALVRMAASPMRERRVRRVTGEAIRFVGAGEIPRTLVR